MRLRCIAIAAALLGLVHGAGPAEASHCDAHILLQSPSSSESCGLDEEGVKEAWIAVIEDYPAPDTDLPGCGDNGPDIVGELNSEGGWTTTLTADTLTLETHFKKTGAGGSDNTASDTADFAYFCGHSGLSGSGSNINSFHAFRNMVESNDLFSWEALYGDVDLEWVTWDSSKSLYIDDPNGNANLDEWHGAFQYLHLMIGWHDSPADADTGFQFFDEMIDHGLFDGGGHKIKTAWFDSFGGCSGNSGNYQNILGEDVTFADDYIHGEGSGAQADKANDGSFVYWGNEC